MRDARLQSRVPISQAALPIGPDLVGRLKQQAARFSLRIDPAHVYLAAAALGISRPTRQLQIVCAGGRVTFWLEPRLLVTAGEETAALAGDLPGAFAGVPHSIIYGSRRQGALTLEGGLAARVLRSDCILDLAPASFPAGAIIRFLFCKIQIVIWRESVDAFHLKVRQSFTDYVFGRLAAALAGAQGLTTRGRP